MFQGKIRSLLIIFLVIFMTGSAIPGATAAPENPHAITIIQSNHNGLTFVIQVPSKDLALTAVTIDGRDYLQLQLPEWPATVPAGAPQVPVFSQAIAVPFDVEINLVITPGPARRQSLSAPILPAATQEVDWSQAMDPAAGFQIPASTQRIIADPTIYQMASPYPGKLGAITNEGTIRQQRVAGISLYPFQYHPDTLEMTIYESLLVEITFIGTPALTRQSAQPESAFYETFFSQNLLNYESGLGWRQPLSEMSAPAFETRGGETLALPWVPPEDGWRITVQEEGFYQLTYAELDAVGLPVDTLDPRTFQMFHLGEEIAIQVSGETDGSFDPGDVILFYGQAIDSKYTRDNIYWLTYGQATGKRMENRSAPPQGMPVPGYHPLTLLLEENVNYHPYAKGPDDLERFLWDFIYASTGPASWFHIFDISNPRETNGILRMALWGFTDNKDVYPDHHALVYLNGQQVADLWWDGRNWIEPVLTLPAGLLVHGDNTLQITLPHDTGAPDDLVYVDWAEIAFETAFQAADDQLAFSFTTTGTWQFTVPGFTTDQLVVYDVSDPAEVVEIINFSVPEAAPPYTAIFEETLAAPKDYRLTSPLNFAAVAAIQADTPSNLASSANGADYIVITPLAFATQAQRLTDWRANQGLRTQLVLLQDIYDEFGFGITGAETIHQFLAYTYVNWAAPAPSFVVLVGDGHYNPKDYNPAIYGTGRPSYLPPYLAYTDPQPGMGETAADNRYVTFSEGDTLPDMMIGRLAVNSLAEAAAFIDKIIAYEEGSPPGDWQRQALIIADAEDKVKYINFAFYSIQLLDCCLGSGYQPELVFLGTTHHGHTAREAIINGINAGKVLVNYVGHAGNSQWGKFPNYLLRIADVPALTNSESFPVVLAMTCWEGYFINPQASSSYHALAEVITRAEGKGAVASWSPTGLGVATGHDKLNQGFYTALFADQVGTLGQAASAGKLNLWSAGIHLDLIDTYMLFGDPATRFLRTVIAINDHYITDKDTLLIVSADDGVFRNDVIPVGRAVTAQLISDVSKGELVFNEEDGSFSYMPNEGIHNSTDTFTYQLIEGTTVYNTATVTITVNDASTPLTAVTISGTPTVGQTLISALTPSEATADYQWQSADAEDGTYTDIDGANGSTYILESGDIDRYIRLQATGSGSYTGTVTSNILGPVASATTPLTAVTISGTPTVGQTLTSALTPSDATADFQWQSAATFDGTYTNIDGAAASTYGMASSDVGRYIRLQATGSGSYTGTVTSNILGPVTTVSPGYNIFLPLIVK